MTAQGSDGGTRLLTEPDRSSAAETAFRRIRELVITGVLRPGQIINEQDLVEHLNIGRTPVREAIQRLAMQHVLEVFPRRGVAIAKLGLEDIQAIFEARETIEEKTAALAAVRHTPADARSLKALGERIDRIAECESAFEFLAVDQRLHHLIAAAARNRYLAESADHLLMLSNWAWHQYFQLRGSTPAVYFRHDAIVQAIIDRDPERARTAMREHVRQSREVIRGVM
jgi:DNA-binding GntR family transcriptional regulator